LQASNDFDEMGCECEDFLHRGECGVKSNYVEEQVREEC